MRDCCGKDKEEELNILLERQSWVLKTILAINATMFIVEFVGGVFSRSSSLLADSLDMLGDASVYGLSIYALNRSPVWQTKIALTKGSIMALLGVSVLIAAIYRFASGSIPKPPEMSAIGALALVANLVCIILLFRHRADNINLKSTWICSRNDIIANIAVLGAAGLVAMFNSSIPDLLVALVLSSLVLYSAFGIIRDAKNLLHETLN